jgi:hypothetical protein
VCLILAAEYVPICPPNTAQAFICTNFVFVLFQVRKQGIHQRFDGRLTPGKSFFRGQVF